MQPTSLENNLLVVEILDAAIQSSKENARLRWEPSELDNENTPGKTTLPGVLKTRNLKRASTPTVLVFGLQVVDEATSPIALTTNGLVASPTTRK